MQNSTYAVIDEPSFAMQIQEIQLRYPSRRQMAPHQQYSTSSGYGSCSASTSSSSSIDTVINAARPYTVPRGTVLSAVPPTVPPKPSSTKNNKRPCCVQCREAEIRQAETRDYENLTNLARCQETQPYIMLMVSILRNHRSAENAQKVAKIQKNVQKVLLLGERQGFSMECEAVFEQQLRCFCRDVEIRLRAINDVSNETFNDVSKRFCDALHANPSALKTAYKNLKAIFKGYEKS